MKLHHNLKIKEVLEVLKTSKEGLTQREAQRRLERFGPNELKKERRVVPARIFARQFKSFLILILIVASAISFALSLVGMAEPKDGIVILSIVILNATLGFAQEYKAEKAMEALKRLVAPKAKVIRGGYETVIQAKEVVPGDVLVLEEGDRVAADARLMKVTNLQVDEAILTGESVPSVKRIEVLPAETPLADRENMVYAGTTVTYGRGEGVVVATGMQTEFGKIAEDIRAIREEPTPLQLRLRHLGIMLGSIILIVCACLFAIQVLEAQPLFQSFMIAVALAVSAVPEGLPAVVTVTLAVGIHRMAKRNAIVRKLASVETLGCTTVICSDKTGTLTKNEMTVQRLFVNDRYFEVSGTGYEPKGKFTKKGKPIDPTKDEHLLTLLKIGCMCNHASLHKKERWFVIGDPTEGALLTLAAKANLWKEGLLREHPLIAEIPFDALRKRMTTIHEVNGKTIAYVKGAPEVVLELCNRIYKGEKVKRLDPKGKEQILSTVKQFAAEALRVLAFAYREVTSTKFTSKEVEKNLIFVGLVGMIDPPREEVKEAIRVCKKAGIKAVMITGDHKLTAEAIAKQIGMLESGKVLTGTELDRMSDKDLEEVVEEVAVYARTSPHHKVRILEALKHKGHVVAMTGDGVNDAPAVKKADIGIAMGIKGTDVTKEASDMVLADDNFATIVNAVKEGRGIYDNIRKFVRFLLCVNFSEILLVTASVLARLPLPLLPIQILWINIVTDGPPALALGVDPYDPRIMERKPRHPKEGILHGMLSFVVVAGLFAFLTGLAVFLGGLWLIGDLDRVRSMVFTQTVMFELFFIFNCRSEEHSVFKIGVTGNRRLLLAIATSVCLQAAVLYIPFLQFYFGTVPLTFQEWTFILLLSTAGLFVLPEVFMR